MISLKVKDVNSLKLNIAMSGLQVKELAANIGKTTSFVSRVINGATPASANTARAIVNEINKYLKTEYTIDDIFFTDSVQKNVTKDNKSAC